MSQPSHNTSNSASSNKRMLWVLASVAVAFFVGIIVKRWLIAG